MRLIAMSVLLCLLVPASAWATAQQGDVITYKGETGEMFSNPLETYFDQEHPRPNDLFQPVCTANWRGYVAYWEVKDGLLYLNRLIEGTCDANAPEIPLDRIFPEQTTGPLFAFWFTGTVMLPRGPMLKYVHMGYQSIFSTEILLEFKEGKLVKETIVDNTQLNLDTDEQRILPLPPKP